MSTAWRRIPVFANGEYFTGLYPQHTVAVGGVIIAVPRSYAAETSALLENTHWVSRPWSKFYQVIWIFLTLAILVPPRPTAVFVRSLRTNNTKKQQIADEP
ncbi:MAG: hypothetical protein R8G34_03515 [Paracoccaceae bacterium]|nr:hypothetical protein [Paracoccaceae bacterium]